MTKAFDRVYIPKLLDILKNFGVDSYIIRWLENYLLGRTGYISDVTYSYRIANGVPQGSVLGPLLFMLYVADLFVDIDFLTYRGQYADDFVLVGSSDDPAVSVQRLNDALAVVAQRCRDLGIRLDGAKCQSMWIGRHLRVPPPLPLIFLEGRVLEYVDSYKYLGVILDNKLSFRQSITIKVAETARRGRFVWRLWGAPKRRRRALWLGYGFAYLSYGLHIYYHLLRKGLKTQLERVYCQAARSICGVIRTTYGPSACAEAGLRPLEEVLEFRRTRLLARMSGDPGPKWPAKGLALANCAHVGDVENAFRIEMVFARWRTNGLYTNRRKYIMKLRDDDLCRYCLASSETREHLLFVCDAIQEPREAYLRDVARVLHCHPRTLDFNAALALDSQLTKFQLANLAKSLCKFLDTIAYLA